MADWFDENAPSDESEPDWFSQNAPAATAVDEEEPPPVSDALFPKLESDLVTETSRTLSNVSASAIIGGTSLGELSQTPLADTLFIDPSTRVKDEGAAPGVDEAIQKFQPNLATAAMAGAELKPDATPVPATSPQDDPFLSRILHAPEGAVQSVIGLGGKGLAAAFRAAADFSDTTPQMPYADNRWLKDTADWLDKTSDQLGAAGASHGSTDPISITLDKLYPGSKVADIYRGASTGTAEALAGLAAPENIPLLAVGGVGGRALAAVFTWEGLKQLPENIKQYEAATTAEEKSQIAARTVVSIAIPALGLKGHAKSPKIEAEVAAELHNNLTNIPESVLRSALAEQNLSPEIRLAVNDALAAKQKIKSTGVEPGEFAKPGYEAVSGEAPAVEPVITTELTDTQKYPVVELPVSELKLSEDVPNFKEKADKKTGVVEGQELQGEYQEVPKNPITVWERLDGTREVITGRHRFDLAKRTGRETVPSQIVREADGFTKEQAMTFDAEANIRDNQGGVGDYANYFRHSKTTAEEASSRGLLRGDKGRKGFAIGKNAGDDLYALYRAGKIPEGKAAAIAEAGAGNPDLQNVGIRAANKGASIEEVKGQIEAAKNAAGTKPESANQSDFFSDTTLGEAWEKQGKYVAEQRKSLQDIVSTRKSVTSKYDAATSTGSIKATIETAAKELADAQTELGRWNEWAKHPDLRAEVETLGAQKAEPVAAEAKPQLLPGEKQGDLISSTQPEPMKLVGEDAPPPHPAFEQHEWTGATKPDVETMPLDLHADQVKLKLKPNKEGGFVNADVLKDVGDFGRRVFEKGMDFGKWSAEMIRHLGEKVKEHLKPIWDSLTGKNILPGARESGAIGGIGIRKRSQLDEATGVRSQRLQQSFADAKRAQKDIARVLNTPRKDNAAAVYREAGGDMATLKTWETAAKGKMFKQAARDAQALKPAEIAMAQKTGAMFDVLERRGNAYDVLTGHRDNYVPHVWDVTKKFSGIGSSKLQDRFKFNKAAKFQTFFEGDQAGFVPKTMGLSKLAPTYLTEMNRVISDRQFVQDVSSAVGSDKRPLVIPRGNAKTVDTTEYAIVEPGGKRAKSVHDTMQDAQAVLQPGQTIEKRPASSALVNPRGFASAKDAAGNKIEQGDYRATEHSALANWRWVESDPLGGSTILKSDLAVHPELAKRLNAMTGQSAIRAWYNEPSSGVSLIPKAIVKGLDTAQSVMKREMFGLLAPFHQVQEGTHGVGHLTNPVSTFDLSKPTAAMTDAMQHGLMLLPDRATGGHYMEGVGAKGTFLTKGLRWVGEQARGKGKADDLTAKAVKAVADVVDGYQDYLFHNYIPGLKFATYEHAIARNMERYAGDIKRGEVTASDVKMLTAEQMNAAYGHLNYSLMDRNPTIQHLLQLGLLAPDFLEARGRFAAQAGKSLLGDKAGHEQLRAIATLAVIQAGTMYTIAKVAGGEWDWKHPFEVVIGNRRYMLRSVPEDLHRLLFQGPDTRREFVSARINPVLQKGIQLTTGLNYRGEKTSATETMEEMLAGYIPLTARAIPAMRNLTETTRNNPVSPLEQLAGSSGLKISRHSPITAVHQMAHEWMDKNKLEKREGVYPISKYQQLRYKLEDGDLEAGKTEWDKLKKDGDAAKLAQGFKLSINHPFTGSKADDDAFYKSLSEEDKLIYDHALKVREGIMHKFENISGVSPSGSSSGIKTFKIRK